MISIPLLHKSDCYSRICQVYARIHRVSDAVKFWKDLKVRFNLDLNKLAAEAILTKVLQKNDIQNIEKIDSFLDPVSILTDEICILKKTVSTTFIFSQYTITYF